MFRKIALSVLLAVSLNGGNVSAKGDIFDGNTIKSTCGTTHVEIELDIAVDTYFQCPPDELYQKSGVSMRLLITCVDASVEIRARGTSVPSTFRATLPCSSFKAADGESNVSSAEEVCPDGTKYAIVVRVGEVGDNTFVSPFGGETSVECAAQMS